MHSDLLQIKKKKELFLLVSKLKFRAYEIEVKISLATSIVSINLSRLSNISFPHVDNYP